MYDIRTSQVIFNIHSMHIYTQYIYICSSTVLSILGHVLCLVTVDSMLKVHSVHCDLLSVSLSLPRHILNLTWVSKTVLLTAAAGSSVLIIFVRPNGSLHVQSAVELFESFHKLSSLVVQCSSLVVQCSSLVVQYSSLVVQCHSLCIFLVLICHMPIGTRAKTATRYV